MRRPSRGAGGGSSGPSASGTAGGARGADPGSAADTCRGKKALWGWKKGSVRLLRGRAACAHGESRVSVRFVSIFVRVPGVRLAAPAGPEQRQRAGYRASFFCSARPSAHLARAAASGSGGAAAPSPVPAPGRSPRRAGQREGGTITITPSGVERAGLGLGSRVGAGGGREAAKKLQGIASETAFYFILFFSSSPRF